MCMYYHSLIIKMVLEASHMHYVHDPHSNYIFEHVLEMQYIIN